MDINDNHLPEEKTEIQLLTEQVARQSELIAELNEKVQPPPPPPKTTRQKYANGLEKLLSKK